MQANGRPSVVKLKSPYGRYDEGYAAATIKPGYLILMDANGKWIPHGTAAGANAQPIFATEEMLTLEGKTIADSYASGDLISILHAAPGDEVQAWLEDNQNVAVDDFLESAGDGTLQPVTTGKVVAQAIEAVNTTGGATAAQQIKVRVMM